MVVESGFLCCARIGLVNAFWTYEAKIGDNKSLGFDWRWLSRQRGKTGTEGQSNSDEVCNIATETCRRTIFVARTARSRGPS